LGFVGAVLFYDFGAVDYVLFKFSKRVIELLYIFEYISLDFALAAAIPHYKQLSKYYYKTKVNHKERLTDIS